MLFRRGLELTVLHQMASCQAEHFLGGTDYRAGLFENQLAQKQRWALRAQQW